MERLSLILRGSRASCSTSSTICAFASTAWNGEHRAPGIAGRRDWYAGHGDERAGRILSEAGRFIDASAGVRTPTVVHGDLHLGQLFLHDGRISGLIDIDTLAVGDPGEDTAAFLSHAIASALLTGGDASDRVWALADLAADRWAGDDGVRGRTLVHLAGHLIAATQRGESAGAEGLENAARAIARGSAPSDGRGAKKALMDGFDCPYRRRSGWRHPARRRTAAEHTGG